MEQRRTHPISIIGNLSRLSVLMLLPVVRGFWNALSGAGLGDWARGAWFDILVVMGILFFAVARWRCLRYSANRQALILEQGVLFQRRLVIPMRQIVTMSSEGLWWLRPFDAVRLRVDTMAGGGWQADVLLTVTPREADRLMGYRVGKKHQQEPLARVYRPSALSIAALSALTSNSFAGILLVSAFLSTMGDLVGREFGRQFYVTLDLATQLVRKLLPPVTGAIALAILGGYLVAFGANCIKHIRFQVRRRGDFLFVGSGFFTRQHYLIDVNKISYVDVRQGLISRFIGLSSASLYCPGFGKRKEDVAAVIPATDQGEMEENLELLLGEYRFPPLTQKPNRGAIGKFIIDPLWPCLLVPGGSALLVHLFPQWSSVILSAGIMASLPAFWFMGVRVADYLTTGLGFDGETLSLQYSKGYYLHRVSIPRSQIAHIHLRQSPIQRFDGSCDVLIYTKGEHARRHHIKNLKRAQVSKLLGLPLVEGKNPLFPNKTGAPDV